MIDADFLLCSTVSWIQTLDESKTMFKTHPSKVQNFTNHYCCFGVFLSEKYLRQISILGTNELEIRKNKGIVVISTFEIDINKGVFNFTDFLLVGKSKASVVPFHRITSPYSYFEEI